LSLLSLASVSDRTSTDPCTSAFKIRGNSFTAPAFSCSCRCSSVSLEVLDNWLSRSLSWRRFPICLTLEISVRTWNRSPACGTAQA
jgi:hypothetical protein